MSERELDSSINDYVETKTPKNYVKQQEGYGYRASRS